MGGKIQEADVKSTTSYQDPFKAQWIRFKLLVLEYFRVYAQIPKGAVIQEKFYWQYIYAALSRNHMGPAP